MYLDWSPQTGYTQLMQDTDKVSGEINLPLSAPRLSPVHNKVSLLVDAVVLAKSETQRFSSVGTCQII